MRVPLSPKASVIAAILLLAAMNVPADAQKVDRAYDVNGANQPPAGTEAAAMPSGWRLDLPGLAPQQQLDFPGKQQTPTTVPASILPPVPNIAKFAQTAPAPALYTYNPFDVLAGQIADAAIPKIPNGLPHQIPRQQNLCSVALLRVRVDPSIKFTAMAVQPPAPPWVPVPSIDRAMVVRPLAPSCDAGIPEEPTVTPPVPIRVAQQVQSAKLIFHPPPEYPPLAKMARIQGIVRLDAVIKKDGTVRYLGVISGHPLLVKAALDAVGHWRYQPTLLNGVPVEVWTEIDVNFTLPQG